MSASSDRATRRELRRAMGEGAISTIAGQSREIEALTAIVNQQTVQIDRLIGEQGATAAHLKRLQDAHDRHVATMRVFVARPLWARLRWIVTGR